MALELKRDEGQKRGVEQLMRYIGHLKAKGKNNARGILVTGCADPHTRRALQGRDHDDHIDWWVYGLKNGKLELKKLKVGRTAK